MKKQNAGTLLKSLPNILYHICKWSSAFNPKLYTQTPLRLEMKYPYELGENQSEIKFVDFPDSPQVTFEPDVHKQAETHLMTILAVKLDQKEWIDLPSMRSDLPCVTLNPANSLFILQRRASMLKVFEAAQRAVGRKFSPTGRILSSEVLQ